MNWGRRGSKPTSHTAGNKHFVHAQDDKLIWIKEYYISLSIPPSLPPLPLPTLLNLPLSIPPSSTSTYSPLPSLPPFLSPSLPPLPTLPIPPLSYLSPTHSHLLLYLYPPFSQQDDNKKNDIHRRYSVFNNTYMYYRKFPAV